MHTGETSGAATAGETFGRYEVHESIGQGAMGVVYRATHRDLEREVALKVLAPQFSTDPGYRARFLSEARTLARLESHHIVAIHDAGELDGSLYLAMQLVQGGDLSGLLRSRGPMPPTVAIGVLRQVALGLQTAHEAGVLHRDIKPSNVLLRPLSDGTDRAYLCDFGIAQDGDSNHTRTGGVVGTWAYLAPERLRGEPATPASDLYAMGCLLWALVTGGPPYAGATDLEIARGHLESPVPQLDGDGPEIARVNHLLRRLMVKSPQYRLASAADLVAEIDNGGAARSSDEVTPRVAPIASPGPSHGSASSSDGARPMPWRWIAAAALALVVIGGGLAAVVVATNDGAAEADGPGELAYAADDEAGIVDAEFTNSVCEEPGEGFGVGGIAPLSGAFQNQGDAVTAGIGLAVSDINAAGGVLDVDACTVVLDEDEASIDELLDAEVPVVVGGVSTAITTTAAQTFDSEGIPFLTPGGFSAALDGTSGYNYRTIADSTAGADALLQWSAEDVSLDYAVVGSDSAPSVQARTAVTDVLDLSTRTCVWGCGPNDARPIEGFDTAAVAAEIVASEADAVVITDADLVTGVVSALEAAGWTGNYYLTYYAASTVFSGLDASVYERVRGVFPAVTTPDAFRTRISDWLASAGGGTLDRASLSGEAYDSTVLAALAAVRGGDTDPETIAENLRPVSGSEGGTTCVTFRQCAELLERDEDIVYQGVAVKAPFNEYGDLTEAYVSRVAWDADGRSETQPDDQILGRTLTEF